MRTKIYRKTVGFSGIQTWIVGVEGEHVDHHHGNELILSTYNRPTFRGFQASLLL